MAYMILYFFGPSSPVTLTYWLWLHSGLLLVYQACLLSYKEDQTFFLPTTVCSYICGKFTYKLWNGKINKEIRKMLFTGDNLCFQSFLLEFAWEGVLYSFLWVVISWLPCQIFEMLSQGIWNHLQEIIIIITIIVAIIIVFIIPPPFPSFLMTHPLTIF